jgi:hypothetical protein
MIRYVRSALLAIGMTMLIGASCSSCWAGGSIALEEIMPLLEKAPAMVKWLNDTLDLDTVGDATRIGQNVNPRLGGTRIGPYTILAKPKGAPEPYIFEVTIETTQSFRDAKGKSVDVSKAHSVEEKFESISIRPYKE